METKKTKFEQGLEKAWKDYLAEERKKKYPNIMLIGVTGAGKSDLINRVLDAEVAKISDNARATLGYCNFYDGHLYGRKVNFIDTEGYELGQSEEYLQNISNGVNANYDGSPVHVIWYCISVANERIEPIDFRILKALKNLDTIHGRICFVFTKCDKDDKDSTREKAIKQALRNNELGNVPTFEVSNDPKLPLQLVDLIRWSSNQLDDEDFRQSFIGSQMVDLERKRKEAEEIINAACLSVGALKLAEKVLSSDMEKRLAEHQMKMVMRIFSVYGIDCLEGITKKFEKSTSLVSFGSGIVIYLTKTIPMIEKYQDYMQIGAATALTKAVGKVASKLSYSYVEKHINGTPVKLEQFYSDPTSGGTLALLIDAVISESGEKLQGDEEQKTTPVKKTSKKKKKKKF